MAAYSDEEFEDHQEFTPEEAFLFRRCSLMAAHRLHSHALYVALKAIADEYDAPDQCECCDQPASTSDSEGVPLCEDCLAGLAEK